MKNLSLGCTLRGFVAGVVVATLVMAGLGPQAVRAAGLDKLDNSLQLVPENAAFYCSTLHCGERIKAIQASRAWAKLKEMPFVQLGLAMYQMQAATPGTVPGQIQEALNNPELRKVLKIACAMYGEEAFVFADQSLVEFIDVAQEVAGSTRFGPMLSQLAGEPVSPDSQLKQGMASLLAQSDRIKVPCVVAGFRMNDTAAAQELLTWSEQQLRTVIDPLPMLKGRLKRTKVGGAEYLTLNLDGKMVPWGLVRDKLQQSEAKPGDADKLITAMKKKTLVLAAGVRGKYLLVSIGPSTDVLAKLGQGKRLIDRPELKPLEKFAGQRLLSISYLSKALAARLNNSKKDIDDLRKTIDTMLPEISLSADQQKRIHEDAAELAKDLKRMIPEAGAIMGFSFATDGGAESYVYNWGEQRQVDGSKPLGLLAHVGGAPLAALVGRGKSSPEEYDVVVKWLRIGHSYFEEYGLPTLTDDQREEYGKVMKAARPLLVRLDKATRTMLIPALADGQMGLVLDAKLQSKQFCKEMKPVKQALPMVEPALVLGVSDAALLRKAMAEYRALANDVLKLIREIPGGNMMPSFSVPEPKASQTAQGQIYSYPLPKEWGVDKQIEPNAGLSATVAVLTASRSHSERLLKATPLAEPGVLADAQRPRAGAALFHWAGLIDALTPWIDLATDEILKEQGKNVMVPPAAIKAQVHTVLEVLKVLRTVSSQSYFEGSALVTHARVEYKDTAD